MCMRGRKEICMQSYKRRTANGQAGIFGSFARAMARAMGWREERWGRFPWLRLCAFPALAAVGLMGVWGVLIWKMHTAEQEARRAGIEHAQSTAIAYEQYIGRTVRQMDQMTRFVAFEYARRGDKIELPSLIRTLVAPAPPIQVSLADARGWVFASSQTKFNPISIADRVHFQIPRDQKNDDLYVSEAVMGRLSGKETTQVARRLLDESGGFAGVVVISMDPRGFTAFYSENEMGREGLLGVVGLDGHYRGMRIADSFVGTGVEKNLNTLTQASGVSIAPAKGSVDGRERFVAWRRVEGYPLVAIAGLSAREEMDDFESTKAMCMKLGAGFSALLLLFGMLGLSMHARMEAKKSVISQTKDAYRAASEGTFDGFFIFKPVMGAGGYAVDFTLADVNDRGAEMLGFSREAMIDRFIRELFPPKLSSEFLAIYAHVWSHGMAWRDAELYCKEPDQALSNRWISHQATRAGNGVAVTISDITNAKKHEERLKWVAEHDAVTELPNRHSLKERLSASLEIAAARNERVALLFIDLDDFKGVNDTLGHTSGDKLLRVIGERLTKLCRKEDWVCRLGGDEFIVGVQGDFTKNELKGLGQRVIESVSQPVDIGGAMARVGASVGISVYPDHGGDCDELLKAADLAMYSAKEAGKGGTAVFEEEMSKRVQERVAMEHELRLALERRELFLVYQTKADLKTGAVKGMEALLRWQSPTRGLVPPLEFIDCAERSGLILPIGERVIEMACSQITAWAAEGFAPIPVSVNVSARQLARGDLAQVIENAMARWGVPRGRLDVELTESSVMENPDFAQKQLRRIKEIGARIHVDDFGTGYSSLALLKKLEIDVLKLDRSFIKDLPHDTEDREIAKAIVSMAQALNLETVAEGVETIEQSEFLRALGCDQGQGYLFSRPAKAEELGAVLPRRA